MGKEGRATCENVMGFLGEINLDEEYSRWEHFWWGADFFDGQYRLQIGAIQFNENRIVSRITPFERMLNNPRGWFAYQINLLEKLSKNEYKFWGSYTSPSIAVDGLLSLVVMKEEMKNGEAEHHAG